MSTPTFDAAIKAYPATGGYEACRKLQQALDFDRGRNTTFEELVHELVRRTVIQAEVPALEVPQEDGRVVGYVHAVPTTGDVPPDTGHTTCTDGEGYTIDLQANKVPPCSGHAQEVQEQVAGAGAYFPNFYGVTEEAMDQLRSSGAVTVMRTSRSLGKSTSQFMWAVPPDAADILEASGQFKRLTPQVPPAETGCTVSEPPPAPSEGPRHPELELALLLHIPEDLRPFFRISVTGTEDAALVSFGNHKGGSEEFRGKLDDVVAHVASLLDATVSKCKEQLDTMMTMTCIPKEKP